MCKLCFESGATKRKCCNQLFCDHCYTKNQACPYCKASTRQEKMTGATFAVESFSEHEECRCCLEPGTKRRCCGSYYCDECYYKLPQCRGCEAPTGNRPNMSKVKHGSIASILLSWFTTLFVVLAAVAIVSVLSANESQTAVREYVVCLELWLLLCSIVVMFHHYWCIRKPWSSSIMVYNNNTIAHNHHTNNNPSIFLHLQIYRSSCQATSAMASSKRAK